MSISNLAVPHSGHLEAVRLAASEVADESEFNCGSDKLDSHTGNWMAGGFDMVGRKWSRRHSEDINLADHLRIHYYGMSKMRKNGHCPMGVNELITMLGKPKMRNDKLKDAINRGVERDYLAHGSNPRCLVMPYDVRYLTTADVGSFCDRH